MATLTIVLSACASAQLNQNCTVSVLNRNVQANADGTWVLPNVPANLGQVKARATCVQNGMTTSGESAFFTLSANTAANLPPIIVGSASQIPVSLSISPGSPSLTTVGQTVQLTVAANLPDDSTQNVTAGSTGTNYTTSNPAIAAINANGLITAVSSGTVVIQALNQGASGILTAMVVIGGATVGGIPVSWILANGLNPNDPVLPMEDPDRDGLTNLQEYQAGTNPNKADTDGDGLNDGDEVNKHKTNPLLPDTDGDRIPDGVEVTTGSNPLDRSNYDLKKATASSSLTPSTFTLSVSVTNPTPSVQLTWKVTLIDGKTTLDLTSDSRTSYTSSILSICNFGSQKGLIYAGTGGSCTITATQNTLTASSAGTVIIFTPSEVSTLSVSGSVAVDVSGSFAYIAAGTNGLVAVDISDRAKPKARGTLGGIGNAVAVRAVGQTIFVADSNGFLRIVQASNPDAPTLLSSLAIVGTPNALSVHGNVAAVATGALGVAFVNISTLTTPVLLARLATSGSAVGVDFDPPTNLAAVAMGTSGLQLVDLSTPTSPKLLGLLPGGNVRRVLLRLPAAILADAQRSITSVNLSDPTKPVITSSLPSNLGGQPVDIAASSTTAMTADTAFGGAVPIINISNPLTPSSLGFWTLQNPGFSSSIALDLSFGYLIVPGTLRILKYQEISDPYGKPPVVSITSPLSSPALIQGQTIIIAASATDDVGVASLNFLVNGQQISTLTAPPYQISYTVPASATMLTFSATANDYGGNTGAASNIQVQVIPDPLTTVKGRVITSTSAPVSGAAVSALSATAVSTADGTFSLPGLPTIRGPIIANAIGVVSGVTLAGSSPATTPIVGGITNVGDIQVTPRPLITAITPKAGLAGSTGVALKITGANLIDAAFSFAPASSITISTVTIAADGASATLLLDIPTNSIGTFALVANAASGNTGSAITQINRFAVIDPNSTADTDGDGFQDAIEAVLGTDPLDPGSVPVIPTATEAESVVFSVLNAPVSGGVVETESVAFSLLNAPVSGAVVETESVSFSLLNSPVNGAVTEVESVSFSVLNAPIGSAGITEAGSSFSLQNNAPASTSMSISRTAGESDSTNAAAREALIESIDPLADSDGDGLPDWFELMIGTDPHNPDSDGDGLTDFEEVFVYRTDPLDEDTDGDTFSDGEEVVFGSDPLTASSTPLSLTKPNKPGSKIAQGALNVKASSRKTKKVRQGGTRFTGLIHGGSIRSATPSRSDSTIQ